MVLGTFVRPCWKVVGGSCIVADGTFLCLILLRRLFMGLLSGNVCFPASTTDCSSEINQRFLALLLGGEGVLGFRGVAAHACHMAMMLGLGSWAEETFVFVIGVVVLGEVDDCDCALPFLDGRKGVVAVEIDDILTAFFDFSLKCGVASLAATRRSFDVGMEAHGWDAGFNKGSVGVVVGGREKKILALKVDVCRCCA